MLKTGNVVDAFKRLHPDAKTVIHAIYMAENRADAVDRVADFAEKFESLTPTPHPQHFSDVLTVLPRWRKAVLSKWAGRSRTRTLVLRAAP